MPKTPRRAARKARKGAHFPSAILGANLKVLRLMRGNLSQEDLAARMTALGHGWSRQTVTEVERALRSVTVEELFGLAVSLNATIATLLSPDTANPIAHEDEREALDLGGPGPWPGMHVLELLTGYVMPPVLAISPAYLVWTDDNKPRHVIGGRTTATPLDEEEDQQ